MSLFSDNIRFLRESRKETQSETANSLEIKRARYEPYESGKVEPPYEILKKISLHFNISVDLLLAVDVRKYQIDELISLDDNRILLPIKVDANGENLIEIVPFKARAGYLTGYADPEFIESLQQISLPFLGPGKYRAFPVAGDSMPPHTDLSFVIGQYLEDISAIKKDKTYILITSNEGIIYKRLGFKNADSLIVESDNVMYQTYEVRLSDVLEIWEYVAHIGRDDSKTAIADSDVIKGMFLELKREIRGMKKDK